MTLSDFQGHSPTASFSCVIFVQQEIKKEKRKEERKNERKKIKLGGDVRRKSFKILSPRFFKYLSILL